MSRVVVLGAGIVGRAAAWDLVRREHEVTVADADREAAIALAEEFGLGATTVDVTDFDDLHEVLDGTDVVVSAVPYRFGVTVAKAAIEARVDYCDFGGNPSVVAEQRSLGDAAEAAGVSIVPDCGLAPGLANVLAMSDVAALGSGPIDRVSLRVGALPARPLGSLGYQLAFNPAGLINEYAEPCEVIRDGQRVEVEPLSEFEELHWEGIGSLEAFHTAGGSSSLPRLLEGRVGELDYKTIRYPGHGMVFRAMRDLGLFDEQVDAATGSSPRSTLLRALATHLPRGEPDIVLVRTSATAGTVTYGHEILDHHDGRFSALARTTAFPATALVDAFAAASVPRGALTMDEAITGAELLGELAAVGIEATVTGP